MKRIISVVLAMVLTLSAVSVFAGSSEIIINGAKADISPEMGQIVEKNSRTFVPIRFLMEYLGFSVEWIDADQAVMGRNEAGESFIMQIGNKSLFYFEADGTLKDLKPMDVEPFLNKAEGRTYVPLRFIAEAMGYTVGWNGATETVTLTK